MFSRLLRRWTRRAPARAKPRSKTTTLRVEPLEDRSLLSVTLFAAGDRGGTPPSNIELWKTDATTAGTVLVKNINATGPTASSDPLDITYVPQLNKWFFSADDGVHGREPWVSDGTTAGTRMIKDLFVQGSVASYSSLDRNFAPFFTYCNGYVYFAANGGPAQGGLELWRTNGTAGNATLVKDINHLAAASEPAKLTALGNALYYVADDGLHGRELWVTTPTGSHMVRDILPDGQRSSTPRSLTAVGNKLFFVATDLRYGEELWVTQGTSATTLRIDIYRGPSNAYSSAPDWLTNYNGKCYFAAEDGVHGRELWVSDGTVPGTKMVKDVNGRRYDPTFDMYFNPDSNPANLTVMGNRLYFSTLEVSPDVPSRIFPNCSRLFKTDGTAAGTVLIKQINSYPYDSAEPTAIHLEPARFTVVGNLLFFSAGTHYDAVSATNENVELWRSDGTTAGTYQVRDIFPYNYGSSKPSKLRAINGKLVFFAYSEQYGRELWVSNGSAAGTTLLKNINTTYSAPYGQGSESYGFAYDGYLWDNT